MIQATLLQNPFLLAVAQLQGRDSEETEKLQFSWVSRPVPQAQAALWKVVGSPKGTAFACQEPGAGPRVPRLDGSHCMSAGGAQVPETVFNSPGIKMPDGEL